MNIHLIALGDKLPLWMQTGVDDYAKRIHTPWSLKQCQLTIPKRHKNANIKQLKQQESDTLLAACPDSSLRIALDEHGDKLNTKMLAARLAKHQLQSQNLSILIGGPDGLADSCLNACNEHWSLSPLTLPHGIARIVIVEQLYRAISLLNNHPYHRA